MGRIGRGLRLGEWSKGVFVCLWIERMEKMNNNSWDLVWVRAIAITKKEGWKRTEDMELFGLIVSNDTYGFNSSAESGGFEF